MSQRRVRDVMQPIGAILQTGMNIRDAQRMLVGQSVSSAPVVDEKGRIQGVVTRRSLIRHEADSKTAADVGEVFTEDYRELEEAPGTATATPIEEAVVPDVVSLPPEAEVSVAADCLRAHNVHRALVLDGDALVGEVSCHDLLAALCEGTERVEEASRSGPTEVPAQ